MTENKPNIAEIFKQFGDLARQKAAQNELVREARKDTDKQNEAAEVTGELTKPLRQDIGETSIMWTWEPLDDCLVTGTLFLQDDPGYQISAYDYLVAIQYDGEPDNYYVFAKESSKLLAGALLSAHQWQFIWKANAGEFLEKELLAKLAQQKTAEIAKDDSAVECRGAGFPEITTVLTQGKEDQEK